MYSSNLENDYHQLITQTNGRIAINVTTLKDKQKPLVFSYLVGVCFVLFQFGSLPERINPAMDVGLFYPNYHPSIFLQIQLTNRLDSGTKYVQKSCYKNNNIDFFHSKTKQPKLPHQRTLYNLWNLFLTDNYHLKSGNFKTTISEHYCMLHVCPEQNMCKSYLKPLHDTWKVSAYEVFKMINTDADPKGFYFRQTTLVSNTHQFKSYLSENMSTILRELKKFS